MIGFKLAYALLGRDEFRHGAIEIQLDWLAFTARSRDCGLDGLADDEAIAPRLSHVTRDEDRAIVGDAHADSRLNQDTVGKSILDQLLSLGESEPAEANGAGQRKQDAPSPVDDELSGKLGLIVHDNGETIAGSEPVIL